MSAAPAFDVPPDHRGAGVVRVWYTSPPGLVAQLERPARGTKEMAEWLVGPAFSRLRQRFADVDQIVAVLDLSLMDGREREARAIILDKVRAYAPFFSQTFVVPPTNAAPVYLSTVHAAAALLSVFGVKLAIVRSLAGVFERCPLKPAGPAKG